MDEMFGCPKSPSSSSLDILPKSRLQMDYIVSS